MQRDFEDFTPTDAKEAEKESLDQRRERLAEMIGGLLARLWIERQRRNRGKAGSNN